MSIQYRAVLDYPNTTSLDVMVNEYVAFDPVHHTHSYEDIPEFELQAYSVEEIFAEKLRAIFQRGVARDYYDLYQLLETESIDIEFDVVLPAFDAKCDHDDLNVDLTAELPVDQREAISSSGMRRSQTSPVIHLCSILSRGDWTRQSSTKEQSRYMRASGYAVNTTQPSPASHLSLL